MTPEQARILGLERKLPSMLMAIESLRRQLAAALQAIRDMGGGVGGGGGGTGGTGTTSIIKAKATTTITKATSSDVPGSGSFVQRLFDGTTKTTGTLAGTCYSDHDVYVLSGSELTLAMTGDFYWVIDVDKCTGTSTTTPAVAAPPGSAMSGGGAGSAAGGPGSPTTAAIGWSPGPVTPYFPPY